MAFSGDIFAQTITIVCENFKEILYLYCYKVTGMQSYTWKGYKSIFVWSGHLMANNIIVHATKSL